MSKDVAVAEPKSALEEFRAAMAGEAIPGLEDIRQEDLTIPVISIDHPEGAFVDKLTGERKSTLDNVVLLGLFKSRVMWPPQQSAPGQKQAPLCRSRNNVLGTPGEAFPWAEWSKGKDKNPEWSPEVIGSPDLSCATCYFAQWGSDPKGDGPRCTLQYTLPIMERVDDDYRLLGLLTVQRTGIKPVNTYISGFVREGAPMFAYHTTISLDVSRNGTVVYSKPRFARGEATPNDVTLWRAWAAEYAKIRDAAQGRDLGDSVVATPTSSDPF